MVDRSIVKTVRNCLINVNNEGIPVSFGIIFGSQVKGFSDRWSDIDLLVVSRHFDRSRDRRDVDLLWKLAAKTDSRIEPIPCGEQQWDNDDSSAIIEIARRDGETISLSEEG
jgi:predicted nucleotidyltransferase